MNDWLSLSTVSVLVITRNRADAAIAAVESVLAGEALPLEIIVVDQSDHSNAAMSNLRATAPCPLRYFWQSASGASRARNEAIRQTRTEIVALIDDDIKVARDWLTKLTGPIKDACDTVTTGAVLAAPGEERIAPSLTSSSIPAVFEGRIERDVLFTGNMAMRRDVVDKIGWFDERLGPGTSFPAAEDNDFGLRLLSAGYRIRFVPDAKAYHTSWRPATKHAALPWAYGRGQGAFYAKHANSGDRYVARRMRNDIFRRAVRIPGLVRTPSIAVREMAFLAGLICGAVHWSCTVREKT